MRSRIPDSPFPLRIIEFLLAALLFPAGEARAGEAAPRVWTLSSWARALRSDPPRDLGTAALCAAGNEWESFQVAVRSEKAARVTALRMSALVDQGGAEIPAAGVRLYRAHQLHVTRPTHRNKGFRDDWYPDALIPFLEPAAGKEPALRAVPFDLPAGETHTFWIDVRVPGSARPGIYKGKVTVEFAGGPAVEAPVELQVFPFALPELATMKTEFGSSGGRILDWCRREVKAGRLGKVPEPNAIYAACAELTTDHRMNSYPPPELLSVRPGPDGSFDLSAAQVEGWRSFVGKYHVNAIDVPSPHHFFKDPAKDREAIHRYLKSWDRALEAIGRPELLSYTYMIDEPNDPKAYEFTRTWGRLIREARSKVKVLVTEQTKTQDPAWGDLYGAVDIWVPLFSLFDPDTAAARRALGEEIWTYTALCQGNPTPWWHLDYPLLNYRVPAWMAWIHHMKGLLYWGGMSYWNDVEDPWTQPETYGAGEPGAGGKKPLVFNGEGSLLYPGGPVGLDGPVPSLRLKAIRDGLEDFEYLTIIESRGGRKEAMVLVESVVKGFYDWSRDPESYNGARQKLGLLAAGLPKDGGAGEKR